MVAQNMGRQRRKPRERRKIVFNKEAWMPKTQLGNDVKNGKISSLDDVFKSGRKIMEPEIIDFFVDDLKMRIIDVKKTTRVTRAGRNFAFRVTVIVGDGNGHIGVGIGKNVERITAQQKAIKSAKLNLIPIKRGCGSWECNCSKLHSIPFTTVGKCASLRVELLPAPNGVGRAVSDTIKPVLEIAGIDDIWSKTRGATDTKLNFVKATIDALKNLSSFKNMNREVIEEVISNDEEETKEENKE